MGPIANQLRQVLTTYTTRRLELCLTFLGLVILMLTQIGMLVDQQNVLRTAMSAMTLAGFPAFVLPVLLVLHVKIQFAHPRSVLTPNFCVTHLTIPAAVFAVLLFGFPVLVAYWTNCDPLGLPAFACALAIPTIWGLQLNRMVGMFVALIILISVARSNAILQWWAVPNNDLIAVRLLIVLAGWTAAAAWLWRLSQLREEMDDYETLVTWRSERPSRTENAAMRGLVARRYNRNRLAATVSDWWHTRMQSGAQDSFRARMRLMEYGLSGWPAESSSLVFAGVILVFGILGGELTSYPMRRVLHAQLGFVLLGALNVIPWVKFLNHRPQLVSELMFPMTRVQLVDCLFATIARQAVVMWIAGYAAAFVVIALYPHETMTLPVAGTFVLFSVSLVVITFGLDAYLATWSSRLLQIIVFGLGLGLLFGLLLLWARAAEHGGAVPVVILALLQLTAGRALIRIARRKWLNLELG